MRLQLLSDLHFETETFEPTPAPDAELLVLAGDIDSTWRGYDAFGRWPVPIVAVAGNHEFDRRDLVGDQAALRERCAEVGIRLLERETIVISGHDGCRIRFVGTTRWSDFDVFGTARRERAMKAAGYFVRLMRSTRDGRPLDAAEMREAGLECRAWLQATLAEPPGDWDRSVVITHFAPSLASADPRYGTQPSTASFCNADDDLLPLADLWLHGHLHAPSDYEVARPDRGGTTRVVCNPRGQARKDEPAGHRPWCVLDV